MTSFQSDANISKLESPLRLRSWAVVCKSGWGRNTGTPLDNPPQLDKNNFFCLKSTFDPRKWCQGGGGGEKGGASPPPREEKLRDFTQNQLSHSQLGQRKLSHSQLGQRKLSQSQLGQRQVSPVNVMRTVQRQNKSQVDLNFQTYETKSHVNLSWISWQNVELTYKESLKMYFFVFCALRRKLELLMSGCMVI